MLDTAATYSGGKNEMLVGSVLKRSRDKVFLASKAGMYKNPDGSREIDGDPGPNHQKLQREPLETGYGCY
jgi:aryl-alcohol dehydrogenase-like predicted oxidoreductase